MTAELIISLVFLVGGLLLIIFPRKIGLIIDRLEIKVFRERIYSERQEDAKIAVLLGLFFVLLGVFGLFQFYQITFLDNLIWGILMVMMSFLIFLRRKRAVKDWNEWIDFLSRSRWFPFPVKHLSGIEATILRILAIIFGVFFGVVGILFLLSYIF